MADNGETLLDVIPIDDLASKDAVVRRLEAVRLQIRSILLGLPAECECSLIAGGTPHNSGLVPMLTLWCPADRLESLPTLWELYDAIETWVERTTLAALDAQGQTLAVPTWEELCVMGRHPARTVK